MANQMVESCIHFHFIYWLNQFPIPTWQKKSRSEFFLERPICKQRKLYDQPHSRGNVLKTHWLCVKLVVNWLADKWLAIQEKSWYIPQKHWIAHATVPACLAVLLPRRKCFFLCQFSDPWLQNKKKNPRAVGDEEATWLTPLTRFFDLITWKKWQCKEVQSMDQEQCVLWSFLFPYLA